MSRQELETKVMDFVKTSFPVGGMDIEASTSLVDNGVIDSMGIIEIIDYVESNFEIKIPDEDVTLEQFGSVESIVSYISEKAQ